VRVSNKMFVVRVFSGIEGASVTRKVPDTFLHVYRLRKPPQKVSRSQPTEEIKSRGIFVFHPTL
jgi:hypothetical protein